MVGRGGPGGTGAAMASGSDELSEAEEGVWQRSEEYYLVFTNPQTRRAVRITFTSVNTDKFKQHRANLHTFVCLLVNKCINHLTYHVLEASQHRSGNDAQEEGHDVEDGSGPQQVIEVHHVLAALHICVFMVASDHLYTASPVGWTERGTAYSQATKVTDRVSKFLGGFFVLFLRNYINHCKRLRAFVSRTQ